MFKDFFFCMYIWVPCACNAQKCQKVAWDPLELKLKVAVSLHVGFGNEFGLFEKAANALNQ